MMIRIGLLLLSLIVSAHALAVPEIETWRTANGARVYFVETHEIPMVSISLAFDAGSARDPVDKLGVAHLTNGLMEEGAGDLSGEQIADRLESVGAELGSENGRDMSVFNLRTLSGPVELDTSVGILAEVLARPRFPDAALQRERNRLLVNLQRVQQSPRAVAERAFYRRVFNGHPYAKPPNGEEQGVRAIRRDDLLDFYHRYFTAENGIIALVGDLSRGRARELADRLFGGLRRGDPAARVPRVPDLTSKLEEMIEFPSQQSHILMGQPGVTRKDPDYFPLYVGNYILGGSGLISQLAVEIREKRGLAYGVSSYFRPMRERGPFIIGLQTRNNQRGLAISLIHDTLAEFVDQGPTQEELQAAIKNITGGFPLNIDSNTKIAGYLMSMAFYGLPLNYLDDYPEKIKAVTVQMIKDAFRRRIDPARLVHVIVGGQVS